MCGVGLKLVKHCTTNLMHGTCEACSPGTFSSHPSSEETCESCTSCEHPNENLEVEEPCSAARNAKCRCRKDHYCVSSMLEVCHLCHPCKNCGAWGVKVPCRGNNNTICNEEIQDEGKTGKIVGIVIGVGAAVLIVSAAVYLWRRRGEQNTIQMPDENAQNEEMEHLKNVEIQPLIPDIAVAVGWKDMKNIATRSKIAKTRIDNCEQDKPGDREEQTIRLLEIWAEEVGRGAPEKLINILREIGKQATADEVTKIVRKAASDIP